MRRCSTCEGKGWWESECYRDAGLKLALHQCPNKCNIRGYSEEVMKRMGTNAVLAMNNPGPTAPPSAPSGEPCRIIPMFGREGPTL